LDISERNQEVLEVIEELTKKNGYPPSYKEIAERVGIAIPGVGRHLKILKRFKYISMEKGKPRTIKVLR
jgi:repressor LexA